LNIGKAVDKLQGNERIVVGRYVDPNGVEYRQTGHRKNFTAGNADEVENCSDDRFILTKGFSNWEGYGTALKPAYEPIILAMKPLDGTFAENALKWGVAGLNIDGARIGTEKVLAHHSPAGTFAGGEPNRGSDTNYYVNQGRFPANLLLDEVSAEILDEQIGISKSTIRLSEDKDIQRSTWSLNRKGVTPRGHNDVGGASRFFYVAKASRSERDAGLDEFPERQLRDDFGIERFNTSNIKNNHPTVKPIKLMNYLVKLTKMPNPNQIYLDPFLGSGTTAIAVVLNRRHFIGIEKEPEYVEVAKKRIEYWSSKANQTFEFEEGNG
jgi:site-specific DNA-methyltransferase (adenine-specific)